MIMWNIFEIMKTRAINRHMARHKSKNKKKRKHILSIIKKKSLTKEDIIRNSEKKISQTIKEETL